MPRQELLFCSFVALAVFSHRHLAHAFADRQAEPVYTDPSQTDEDYHYQGEYRGWQSPNGEIEGRQAIGLQVVALGDGKFSAAKYYGGLPGEGWFGGERFSLQGARYQNLVQLAGEQYDIILDGQEAVVKTHDGRNVGRMKKIHRFSQTMGAKPPSGATVLFDGSGTDHFQNGKMTEQGWLMAGASTKETWTDFWLHAEFLLPYKPHARGQARGNSGFYLQSRYEVQVLDSFGLSEEYNHCGALYKTRPPDFNMCLPPLQWQTYDIDFTAARFDETGKKTADMRITVWHNGEVIHNNVAIPNKTGAGKPEGPDPLPIRLQDHGNPVVYRNIWIIDKTGSPQVTAAWSNRLHRSAPMPIGFRH